MPVLPQLLIDNSNLFASRTIVIRNNVVRDIICDHDDAKGIEVIWGQDARLKENKVYRINSRAANSYGITVQNCNDLLLFYNMVSRTQTGFKFESIDLLNVYNATAHDCWYGIYTLSPGTFRNIALSAYHNTKYYKQSIGFSAFSGTIDLDYVYHFNLGQLNYGPAVVVIGDVVSEKEILYMDEPNDDLTPDHISEIVGSGTINPAGDVDPDIGGVSSEVTNQLTADRKYHFQLLDNSFWYVENDKAIEVSFIKAFQSRILANSELANTEVENNTYLKFANGVSRFTELYPMYARYCNSDRFQKRVMDMWYTGQNCGTVQGYQNSIGGYNLLPTFMQRLLDIDGSWIINESYIDYDNYLLGLSEQRFGIGLDLLGLSTLTVATSAECYRNVMSSVADVGPVEWLMHEEVEPDGYIVFTDMRNGFDNCSLSNMVYSDQYTIIPKEINLTCEVTTPAIPLAGILTYTGMSSGFVEDYEFSLLDRNYSEDINREIYYRVGDHSTMMGSWITAKKAVGETFSTGNTYVQFKLTIENVARIIDYEFVGIAIRHYYASRDWNP